MAIRPNRRQIEQSGGEGQISRETRVGRGHLLGKLAYPLEPRYRRA